MSTPPDPVKQMRHDILNTVQMLKMRLRVLRDMPDDAQRLEAVGELEEEVRRLTRQLEAVFDHVRPDP